MMGAHHQSTAKGTVVGICDGRVCIVTGAGRGIGREHSLMLAEQGAKVVVNDIGGEMDGSGRSTGPAQEVVDEIVAAGGEAVVNGDDISTWDGAERLVQQAISEFGTLDVVINNAGILRDRMLANMTEAEWDAVIAVHLSHGVKSSLQTLGLVGRRFSLAARWLGYATAAVVLVGNCAIVLAVWLGYVR